MSKESLKFKATVAKKNRHIIAHNSDINIIQDLKLNQINPFELPYAVNQFINYSILIL